MQPDHIDPRFGEKSLAAAFKFLAIVKPMGPFFSVLIPTYNRSQLLGAAIQSVLDQTEGDFELVISNGGSTDNTKEVVEAVVDSRLRYIETPGPANMAENYATAVQHARGKYIVFFSDDDALLPTALQRLKDTLVRTGTELVVFPFARYYPEGGEEGYISISPNSVLVPAFTSDLKLISADAALRQYFYDYGLLNEDISDPTPVPYIGNYAVATSVIDQIGRTKEALFATIPIDNYFVGKILSLIDSYYLLDMPLLVWSRWPMQATAVANLKGTELRRHYEKQLAGDALKCSPFPFALPYNLGANALVQAREDLENPKHEINPDWEHFTSSLIENLIYLRGNGVDTREELANMFASRPEYKNRGMGNRVRSWLRSSIPRSMRIAVGRLRRRQPEMAVINGGSDFDDFLSCAGHLEHLWEETAK